jgi:hypothetical protein
VLDQEAASIPNVYAKRIVLFDIMLLIYPGIIREFTISMGWRF